MDTEFYSCALRRRHPFYASLFNRNAHGRVRKISVRRNTAVRLDRAIKKLMEMQEGSVVWNFTGKMLRAAYLLIKSDGV